jgi:hypothetical protein
VTVTEAPPRAAPAEPPAAVRPPRWRSPHAGGILGLAAVFVSACLIYGFQAWHHQVPWLFQDEIAYASEAREFAATGKLTIRGEPSDD